MASLAPATNGGASPVPTPDAPPDAPVDLLPPLSSLQRKHGLVGKQTGKRKSVFPGRPRNKEEREAMRYSSNSSMFAYMKLPAGRPTNPVIPTPTMAVALESTATLASNVFLTQQPPGETMLEINQTRISRVWSNHPKLYPGDPFLDPTTTPERCGCEDK